MYVQRTDSTQMCVANPAMKRLSTGLLKPAKHKGKWLGTILGLLKSQQVGASLQTAKHGRSDESKGSKVTGKKMRI